MSIWKPATVQDAMNMAQLLNPKAPHDLLLLHAALGHHFNGDMGLVMSQGYVLKGKPSLGADAMCGIVRSAGICDYIKVVLWDETQCSMEMKRRDEAEPHTFTYNLLMANAQGLTRNRNWQSMPRQMLRARCLTMGLRAVFPEAVSGLYSADEMADADTSLSDQQRAEVQAQSLGADLPPSQPPRAQSQRQSQQHRQPERQTERQPESEPQPQTLLTNQLYDFDDGSSFNQFKEDWGVDSDQADVALDAAELTTTEEREAFSYGTLAVKALIKRTASLSWWVEADAGEIHDEIAAQFPMLKELPPNWYGPRLCCGAFMEGLKLASTFTTQALLSASKQILAKMHPLDWNQYNELKRVTAYVT